MIRLRRALEGFRCFCASLFKPSRLTFFVVTAAVDKEKERNYLSLTIAVSIKPGA